MNKELEFMPIGHVSSKEEMQQRINNQEMELYIKIKKNRKKQKEIAAKNSTKKSIQKNIVRAALLLVSTLTVSGCALHRGTNNIVNEIDSRNFVNKQVYSLDKAEAGYILYEGTKGPINKNEYLEELCKLGLEEGFTQEEIAIYCDYVYGTDFELSAGISEELQTKLNACLGYNNEKLEAEGRGGR